MKALLIFLLSLLFPFLIYAQQDGLDPTFVTNGVYLGDTSIYSAFLVQPDGKILISQGSSGSSGDKRGVMRFNLDGTVDEVFANSGYFTVQLPNIALAHPYPVCVQPDGKIILAGAIDTTVSSTTPSELLLIRLHPNGSYDSTFGTNGIYPVAWAQLLQGYAVTARW